MAENSLQRNWILTSGVRVMHQLISLHTWRPGRVLLSCLRLGSSPPVSALLSLPRVRCWEGERILTGQIHSEVKGL